MRASKLGKRPKFDRKFWQVPKGSAFSLMSKDLCRYVTVAPWRQHKPAPAHFAAMTRKGGRVTADQVKKAGGPAQLIAQLVSDLVFL